jgi:SPX domain protein involved in polyphosphate accumulation
LIFLPPQAPVLRTEYLRSAWQAYDDNAVRFSLDEHMLLLREAPPAAGSSSSSTDGWCRLLESLHQIPSTDAVR